MHKVASNYLYNVAYQLFSIFLPLITTPYVARVLGPDLIGQYSFTNSIVQYFILIGCLGLNLYGQREIAYHQNDKTKYSKIFVSIFLLKAITVMISLIAYFLFVGLYEAYTLIFLIQTIDIISSVFDITWLFQGLENFKNVVIRNFLIRILSTVTLFAFIRSSNDFYLYIACHSITSLFSNAFMWINIKYVIKKCRINLKDLCIHIRPAVFLFIPQIAASLYTILDKTMLGIITGIDSEVAFYQQAQTIVKMFMALVTSLGTVMMPRNANAFSNRDYRQINKNMLFSFSFIFILAIPMIFGLISVSDSFVPWFFGPGYDKVVLNIDLMSPIILFIGLTNIIGTQYLLVTGKQTIYTLSIVFGTIINFVCNLIFIPFLLSYGASLGTLVSEFCVLVYQTSKVKKDFKVSKVVKSMIRPLFAALIMTMILFYIKSMFENNIILTLCLVVIGVIIYLTVLFVLRDPFLKKICNKFIHKEC